MRWDDVQLFLAVADHGTLRQAGHALDLHPSTVYRRLQQLEEGLSVRLFHTERGVHRLTEAGHAAHPHARAAQEALTAFERTIVGHDQEPAGTVRLTAPESLLGLLTPLVDTFRSEHPRIELQMAFSDRFLDLGRREADVALRPTTEPPEDPDRPLVRTWHSAATPIVWVARLPG